MTARHIVAMGGGGFSMEPDDPRMDDYVLALTDKSGPRVLFLATAGGDSAGYIERFHAAFPPTRAVASHLALFDRGRESVRDVVLAQDVVYVGGGNTANLLAVWRVHGVDSALREAWEAGVVLCGVSAGGMCWFEGGATDSLTPDLSVLADGLGLLRGAFAPHCDETPRRWTVLREAVERGFAPGYGVEDGAALHFVGTELVECVTTRAQARVRRIDAAGREAALPTRVLG